MADRKVTFLIIARDFASRTLKNVGDSTDRTAQKLRNLNTLGLSPVATAGAALGPALLPVVAGATVGAIGLGTAFLGAGAATAVFGGVVKQVVTDVGEASQKSEDLRTKISLLGQEQKVALAMGDTKNAGKFADAQAKAIIEYKARLAELPAPMRAAVMGLDRMRSSWKNFVASNRSPVLRMLALGMNTVAAALPKLQPLFAVAAQYAGYLVTAISRFVTGGGLDRVVAFLTARAGPAFEAFGGIILSVGAGFGYLLAPFARTSDGIVAGLDRMSLSFVGWARSSGQAGMERILAFARDQGPGAAAALWTLATSIGTIARAAAPLAPVSVAIASALASIINAMPQPVLTALVGGFVAWNVALRASAVLLRGQLILGGLIGIYTGISAAVRGVALAENASAVATRANAVATWAMNSALLANPITWVVIALVALGVALYEAYQHSETFRRIVQTGFAAVISAGRAVLGFFQGVPAFFSRVWGSITGAFSTATGWIGAKLTQLGQWFQALPGRIMAGLAALPGLYIAFWRFVLERGAYLIGYMIGAYIRFWINLPGQIMRALARLPGLLSSLWSSVWSRTRSTVSAGVSAVVSFFAGLPGRARSAVSRLWSYISGSFSSAASNARTYASRAVSNAIAYFSQLPGRARSAISGLPGQIRGVFAGAGSWLVSAGRDIIMGLVRGVGNAVGAAVSEARRVAGSIVSGVKAGLGIGSPSRVMADEVGRWIPPGILTGIHAAVPGLLSGMGGVMSRLVGAASTPVVGQALLSAEAAYGSSGGRPAMAQAGGGEVLQPVQLVVDGKVLQQVLLRLKRNNGGAGLGLA